MMRKIHVLKAFRFSHHPEGSGRLPVEIPFAVGEHEVEDAIATHPWMAAYADGCIETPQAAVVRTTAVKARADEAQANALNAMAQAESAVARLTRAQPEAVKDYALSNEDLNTPLGELRARHGEALSQAPDPVRRQAKR
jgi:hypothetical protein